MQIEEADVYRPYRGSRTKEVLNFFSLFFLTEQGLEFHLWNCCWRISCTQTQYTRETLITAKTVGAEICLETGISLMLGPSL